MNKYYIYVLMVNSLFLFYFNEFLCLLHENAFQVFELHDYLLWNRIFFCPPQRVLMVYQNCPALFILFIFPSNFFPCDAQVEIPLLCQQRGCFRPWRQVARISGEECFVAQNLSAASTTMGRAKPLCFSDPKALSTPTTTLLPRIFRPTTHNCNRRNREDPCFFVQLVEIFVILPFDALVSEPPEALFEQADQGRWKEISPCSLRQTLKITLRGWWFTTTLCMWKRRKPRNIENNTYSSYSSV